MGSCWQGKGSVEAFLRKHGLTWCWLPENPTGRPIRQKEFSVACTSQGLADDVSHRILYSKTIWIAKLGLNLSISVCSHLKPSVSEFRGLIFIFLRPSLNYWHFGGKVFIILTLIISSLFAVFSPILSDGQQLSPTPQKRTSLLHCLKHGEHPARHLHRLLLPRNFFLSLWVLYHRAGVALT